MPDRRPAIHKALCAACNVTVDLRALANADPTLFLDLAVLSQRLRRTGHALRLVGLKPHIRRLVEIMGIPRMPAIEVSPA